MAIVTASAAMAELPVSPANLLLKFDLWLAILDRSGRFSRKFHFPSPWADPLAALGLVPISSRKAGMNGRNEFASANE